MDNCSPQRIPPDMEGPWKFHGTSADTKNHRLGTPDPELNKLHLKRTNRKEPSIDYINMSRMRIRCLSYHKEEQVTSIGIMLNAHRKKGVK